MTALWRRAGRDWAARFSGRVALYDDERAARRRYGGQPIKRAQYL
ncbi:hypothetical protein [Streptomyces sp. NBC_00316]|nr:hypothetical protein [Streptomyces sp. NBC_00316]